MEPAIEARGLCKAYSRGFLRAPKRVLRNVCFSVPRGCVFGFLGPNGAGKSTTIKVMLDFVHAQAGEVRVLGLPHKDVATRRRIGYLPETADYYDFLSPSQLLHIYARLFGIPAPEAGPRIPSLLDLVGLRNEKHEKIGAFSKGMKQRVGIAQALLNQPELLILDEPTSGLDPIGIREIRELILDQKRQGRTVFFSSHELAEVEAVCDEAAIIRAGEIVRAGSLDALVPYREEFAVRVRASSRADALRELAFVQEVLPPTHSGQAVFIAKSGLSIEDLARETRLAGLEVLSIAAIHDSLEDIFVRLMKDPS